MNAIFPAARARRRARILSGLLLGSCCLGCQPEAHLEAVGAGSAPTELTLGQSDWAGWERFAQRFITPEGRVVDRTFGGKSTSEGQAYGLFFALVAGDRRLFERIRRWTSAELAAGKLGETLPAWLWARREDGSWGVKDSNAASDADLWLAYTLLEAGRHWQEQRYSDQGRALLRSIAAREVVELDGGRSLLLPGPYGFDLGGGRYRFNPSYLPGFLFLALGTYDPAGPWERIWATYQELAPQMFPAGVAPDLCIIDRHGRVFVDRETAAVGSYDAIRVYLWAGLSPAGPRSVLPLLHGLVPLLQEHGMPPEKLDAMTGRATAVAFSPPGFQGAVLPYLSAVDATELLAGQQRRVETHIAAAKMGAATQYYDEALILFGAGWQERRYRFDEDGHLVLPPGR
jgi:endo-1,4-beta-D-glucanase Y